MLNRSRRRNCEGSVLLALFVGLLWGVFPVDSWAGDPGADQEHAFVLTTDYAAAEYATIKLVPPRDVWISPDPPHTDAVAHYDYNEDMVFIVNRYLADNIQLVDPNQGFDTIDQHSVGLGSNPHDIRLFTHDKAYVSRYEWKTLLIMNPFTGAFLDSIDLSPLVDPADPDGIPEMDRMAIVDGKLFVTLNNINRTTWMPAGPGRIAVIDVAADSLIDVDPQTPGVQPIVMQLPNPYGELRYDAFHHQLVVGCLGSWSSLDGGVEAIDPFTFDTEVLISEADLGGDVSDALISGFEKGHAVIMDPDPWPDNYARLVAFDPGTGEVTDTLFAQTSGMGSSLATIELDRQGELYLCDRDFTQPGVRVYNAESGAQIEFIDVGLPPFDVAFVQMPFHQSVAGGDGIVDGDWLALGQNYPNPFNPETVIPFRLIEDARVRVGIFDVRGRKVAGLLDASLPAGTHSVGWSGKDDAGRDVHAGVFFCRVWAGNHVASRKLILAR